MIVYLTTKLHPYRTKKDTKRQIKQCHTKVNVNEYVRSFFEGCGFFMNVSYPENNSILFFSWLSQRFDDLDSIGHKREFSTTNITFVICGLIFVQDSLALQLQVTRFSLCFIIFCLVSYLFIYLISHFFIWA